MDTLYAIFAFGTIWWFLISGAWIVAVFWCVETSSLWGSGIWTILYLVFLQIFVKVNMLDYAMRHPLHALLYVLGYIALGFGWSFIKWWLYVNKQADNYKEKRADWLEGQKESRESKGQKIEGLENITLDTPVPEKFMDEWKRSIGYGWSMPRVHENKSKISIWVIYWPVSMIWSVINDFIKRFVKTIIMKIRVIYDGITKLAFRKIEKLD